ncbi:MAG: glycoside hydrolase family 9 protein [Oscillospiraceae bacterium]|nr:glycoside hydrolase family 9 protein [Oscillospiraceae bacterium]
MREEFRKELINTGYVHKLLPLHEERSVEARLLKKPVLKEHSLWDGVDAAPWAKEGVGEISCRDGNLRITTPPRSEHTEPMGHYANYHYMHAILRLQREDWTGFNRVRCSIYADCPGYSKPFLTICLRNDGEQKIPDIYDREGYHYVNLCNHRWNNCVWEFPDLPRDAITELSFFINCNGKEIGGADEFTFKIKDIYLEKVEDPDVSLGWLGNESTICYSTVGYQTAGRKRCIVRATKGSFTLEDESGNTVYSGDLEKVENEKGVLGIADFSEFNEKGVYRIKTDTLSSEFFPIDERVMEEPVWKAINYLYGERCGYPVNGGHGYCHGDIVAQYKDYSIPFNGGWHDAGDVSQQTLQTAEVALALMEMRSKAKHDPLLRARLDEEARWGLDFVLRTRLEDGYRATGVGILRYTDNRLGTNDDETARVHNRSFDNFLMAGVEAIAGFRYKDEDRDFAWKMLNAAKEDFAFAMKRFNEVGVEPGFKMEHTHNASLSQFRAVIVWSASELLRATGDEYYAETAREYASHLLTCQEDGGAGLPFRGFFYREPEKRTIVHFNHQSREHIFAQALISLIKTQPDATELVNWESALRHLGDYYIAMAGYAEPYGMLPAGVHRYDEFEDCETFSLLHVYTTYDKERENYREQLNSGKRLDDNHCLRHFPVWFSFRGNCAVHLSSGAGAGMIGRYFNDRRLMDIANDQLYFTFGINPFGQSLMYGAGYNYAQQYAYLAGELTGELPVGIQTRGNEDRPYWPMANNATYKEIWTSSVGRWLLLAAIQFSLPSV